MIGLVETPLAGVYVVQSEKARDTRGYFTRLYCQQTFAAQKVNFIPQQNSLSHNTVAGTLRGMHFQHAPAAEQKLVTCLKGKIYDVAVDLRKGSPTYKKWFCVELSPENGLGLYIPKGLAHGFITLEDDTDVLYQIDGLYEPTAASGLRWDDAAIGIKWPRAPSVISDRDKEWPAYGG
jgi:dTDP-4-dehydrorhamnose 3,5-epimerase